MTRGQLKGGYFTLEALNAFSTAYYFYYLFFYARDVFHFGNAQNLALSALHGFVYMFAAWQGGRFAQRFGYFTSLKLGFSIMSVSLAVGLWAGGNLPVQLAVLAVWTGGMCFIWPTLEALVSEGEPTSRLKRMVGYYNITWAGASAIAYFLGGAMMKHLGRESLFWLPMAIHMVQLGLTFFLKARHDSGLSAPPAVAVPAPIDPEPVAALAAVTPKTFLRMAWVANPFAYVAINAAVPIIPSLAERLGLSTMMAGIFCSIWFFARLLTFVLLWWWPGWHYRLSWLISANVLLVGSFAAMLLAPTLWAILVAQLIFGYAVGLIYYSSLFYSMDVGTSTQGEHGGIHEAAIGAGVFGGSAVGAVGQYVLGQASSSTHVVGVFLAVGFIVLLRVQARGRRASRSVH